MRCERESCRCNFQPLRYLLLRYLFLARLHRDSALGKHSRQPADALVRQAADHPCKPAHVMRHASAFRRPCDTTAGTFGRRHGASSASSHLHTEHVTRVAL